MTEKNKIWIVDDDKSIRWVLEKALTREGLDVVSFEDPRKLLQRFHH
jgi:two-component system nitrogen regulation response regulator GlnG